MFAVISIAGCASQSREGMSAARTPTPSSSTMPPQQPAQRVVLPPPTILGYSVQHRPIELYQFGAGPRPVLVMGAIHGSEPTSANISHGLLEDLARDPSLADGVPVAIIPFANPDGYAARTRTNAHGVDLNRNFPASNYSTKRRATRANNNPGQQSASEPETAALIAAIERWQPRLIISVHSMDKPTNNYDGPAREIAELMSRHNGYPPTATIGYPTPGSLGSWAGIDRQIPMITLELPHSLPASRAWADNRQAVLAAIAAARDVTTR
jgi:protein MpaA